MFRKKFSKVQSGARLQVCQLCWLPCDWRAAEWKRSLTEALGVCSSRSSTDSNHIPFTSVYGGVGGGGGAPGGVPIFNIQIHVLLSLLRYNWNFWNGLLESCGVTPAHMSCHSLSLQLVSGCTTFPAASFLTSLLRHCQHAVRSAQTSESGPSEDAAWKICADTTAASWVPRPAVSLSTNARCSTHPTRRAAAAIV